jgi:Rad3-related DNA helicase
VVIIIPDNNLLDQYAATYPDLNVFKGAEHYASREDYQEAKKKLWQGAPTLTNPLAWYYYKKFYYNAEFTEYSTRLIILDEFHKIEDQLRGVSGGQFSERQYPNLPNTEDPHQLIKFLDQAAAKKQSELQRANEAEEIRIRRELERLHTVSEGLRTASAEYVTENTRDKHRKRLVKITRHDVDPAVLQDFCGATPMVLMSATPRPTDIALFSNNAVKYVMPSEIPVANRKLVYEHIGIRMNKDTNVLRVKQEIDKILAKHPGQNAVIHLPYWRQPAFAQLYPHAITHQSWNKGDAIAEFKRDGGLLLASGCAEGIDLPGSQCRVQIIPWMLRPSLGDKWVKSRKGFKGGREWYDWNVMLTLAQMTGRSTRGKDDFSVTYTFDPGLRDLYVKYKNDLWSWFRGAIEFNYRRIK